MTKNKGFDREKTSFFSIVCYGIHSKLNNWIKHEFEKYIGQKPIAFYEYFLATPITKEQARKKLVRDELQAYSPFLFRILNEREWIPEMGSMKPGTNRWQNIKMVNSSFETLKKFWSLNGKGIAMADVHKMPIMSRLVRKWKRPDSPDIVIDEPSITNNKLEKLLNDSLKRAKTNLKEWLPFIQEYSLVVLPWLQCPSKEKHNIYACSISSKNLFFGEVMIFYPKPKEKDVVNERIEVFKRELKRVVEELYLPVLTLFENHWAEVLLDKALDDDNKKDKPEDCKCVFLREDLGKSKEPLEQLFYDIWKERAKIIIKPMPEKKLPAILKKSDYDFLLLMKLSEKEKKRAADKKKRTREQKKAATEDKKRVLKLLEDSLQYGKYIIASPGLLNEFKRISFVHKAPDKKRKYLSSFLVIGGPGSGKDRMASIVQLLYPEYRFGKKYTINMAALKPGFLSVPLLSGSELVTESKLNGEFQGNYEITFKGIFKKIWEHFLGEDSLKDEDKAKKRVKAARDGGTLPVVILDELNSLDIDAQGSLLRILQNMKVQSLGSIDEYPTDGPKMNFLVVGVVNEPEESLTLENTLHRLSEQREIIGSLATSMLYEKLRGMRRLREDLYHRLIRDGKIDLKTLAERREDIPILFSFFVKSELPKSVKWFDLWIDLNVFETLMDPRIAWEGNFRQLQSIAKKVVMQAENENREALKKIEGGKANKAFYRIKADMVEKVLQEDYGIMPKHLSPFIVEVIS